MAPTRTLSLILSRTLTLTLTRTLTLTLTRTLTLTLTLRYLLREGCRRLGFLPGHGELGLSAH